MRKIYTIVVIVIITMLGIVGGVTNEGEENNKQIRDGKCGDNLSWSLTGSTLRITGTGSMYNYSDADRAPWFADRLQIITIVIDEGVTSIGKGAFSGLHYMTQLSIPSGVISIGDYAFNGCTNLPQLTLPSTISSIETDSFINCDRLSSILVESGNTRYKSIDGVLIDEGSHILLKYPRAKTNSSYTTPEGLYSIGVSAFANCDYLVDVKISSGIVSIERAAFYSCPGLTHIDLPASLTSIGQQAFCGTNLNTLTIPANVESIYHDALDSQSLSSINVQAGNTHFASVDGVLFDSTLETIIRFPMGKNNDSYAIPSTVTSIGQSAFIDCENLRNVSIPESVVSIGRCAFCSCSGIKSIVIPESVTTIKGNAFYNCRELKSVFFQGSTIIDQNDVFTFCGSLESVCVSPEYHSTLFCGRTVNSTEFCNGFKELFTYCQKGSYEEGKFIAEKWSNVTAWEKNSNHCFNYQCNNETGELYSEKRENAIQWEHQTTKCIRYQCDNESGEKWSAICGTGYSCMMDSECVPDKELDEYGWRVEVEIGDVQAVDVNSEEVVDYISVSSGANKNDVAVGMKMDENGNVIMIVCLLHNEELAQIVAGLFVTCKDLN